MNAAVREQIEDEDRRYSGDEALLREQYFFTLYRILVAAWFALLAFGSLPEEWVTLNHPRLAAWTAASYLVAALGLLLHGRLSGYPLPDR